MWNTSDKLAYISAYISDLMRFFSYEIILNCVHYIKIFLNSLFAWTL